MFVLFSAPRPRVLPRATFRVVPTFGHVSHRKTSILLIKFIASQFPSLIRSRDAKFRTKRNRRLLVASPAFALFARLTPRVKRS